MLVTMKEILVAAREGGYAVTAPNTNSEDLVRAAISAAVENKSPMILDLNYGAQPDCVSFGLWTADRCKEAPVPIAINQDHGAKYEHAVWAIRAGYTSVMADRSTLPFEENIAQVSEIARMAHAVNISIEAELGHVGQASNYEEDRDAGMTNPAQAVEYVERTGVDCLAVAIGTAHGLYKGTPKLDFDLLHKLFDLVKVPLVLHGGSGSGDENLAKASREGISKINIATYLMRAGNQAIVDSGFPNPKTKGRYSVTAVYQQGFKDMLVHYMKLTGQCGTC